MIRAAGTTKTGDLYLYLGLTAEDLARLVAGEPVGITAADMVGYGLPGVEVSVNFGRTDEEIIGAFRAAGFETPLTTGGDLS